LLLTAVDVGGDIGIRVTGGVNWLVVGVTCIVEEFVVPEHEASNQSTRKTLPPKLIRNFLEVEQYHCP